MDIWNPVFSHIYVEKEAFGHPVTQKIMQKYVGRKIVGIDHYKDVFNRSRQNNFLQKKSQNMILGIKKDNFLYEGSGMCDSFGNRNFYYTTSVMNCIYNCEYCYLQGMYPSSNIVIFVNIEDTLRHVREILKEKNLYLCVSYDSDLMALEELTGFLEKWISLAAESPGLKIEIRTKSANFKSIEHLKPAGNIILAWTLSPAEIIESYEINTPSFDARLKNINRALALGWQVRLCFDPVLRVPGWESIYGECIDKTFRDLPGDILDVSAGVFRISGDYIKRMRRIRPDSGLMAYPFTTENDVCSYDRESAARMKSYLKTTFLKYVPEDKIFVQE